MGQCTSGDLPPAASDGADGNTEEASPERRLSASEINSQRTSNRKLFGRRSSNSSWVSTKFGRRSKTKDLSAAFNLLDYDAKMNLLNINTATEEELMTLPGVTRPVAKNIVEYRTALGGFRRVEDLALVSGVGAAKLQAFKCDITVKKRSSSRSSSRTQSVDSLPSCDSARSQRSQSHSQGTRSVRSSPVRLINVNAASIFELMNVRGMNQEMAANIVDHRERKGPFRSIEDLVKVKGVSGRVLSILRMYLTVNDVLPASPLLSDVLSVSSYSKVLQRNHGGRFPGHRRTHSAPLNNDGESGPRPSLELHAPGNPRNSLDFSADIYELLSLRSERPIISAVFNGVHNGHPAIRIATWNLQQLTKDKVCNPGVLEVICRTMLENGFSLLAIQEVGSKDVLEKICSELNQSSLRRVREWGGPKGEWRWQVSEEPAGRMFQGSEYAAFIYNASHGLQLMSATLLNIHSNNNGQTSNNNNNNGCNRFTRKPYLGYFKAHEFDFVVVSLHIKAHSLGKKKADKKDDDETVEEEGEQEQQLTPRRESKRTEAEVAQLASLVSALKEKLINERDIVLLGDFNLFPDATAFRVLRDALFTNIVPADTFTNISAKNTKGSNCYDNIWLNPHTKSVFTGKWGVVRQGLSHLAIPSGWGWGGVVSDHCPVYCDLYAYLDLDPGQTDVSQVTGNQGATADTCEE